MSTNRMSATSFVLAAVCAAVLSACGGGGGGTSALTTASTNTASSASSSSSNTSANSGASSNTSGSGKTGTAAEQNSGDLSQLQDISPLEALNLDEPLHTSFISSSGAQQNNPNVQLREINHAKSFTYDQGGLISSLAFNQHAEVKLDGVAVANNTSSGSATQVNFTTPVSMIAKAYSGGISAEDVSAHTGEPANSKFAVGKASFDSRIASLYSELEAAKKVLESKEADEAAKADAQKKKDQLEPVYEGYMKLRPQLAQAVEEAAGGIAYIRKDKNGLVFDKKFDGAYIVQFADGTQIVLQDSAAAGWTYQTFARYTDTKNGVIQGYQSLGDETKFAELPASGTATYKGLSVAHLLKGDAVRQMTADVTAIADFARKGVRFETANTRFHELNNGVRVTAADKSYDMKGTATWSGSNQFAGTVQSANQLSGELKGKFYGAGAAEIGGVYGLRNAANTEQLIGGYGAKRR